jgi:hypothetical protein
MIHSHTATPATTPTANITTAIFTALESESVRPDSIWDLSLDVIVGTPSRNTVHHTTAEGSTATIPAAAIPMKQPSENTAGPKRLPENLVRHHALHHHSSQGFLTSQRSLTVDTL